MGKAFSTTEIQSLAHNQTARRRVAYGSVVASCSAKTGNVYVTVDGPVRSYYKAVVDVSRVISGIWDGSSDVLINFAHAEVVILKRVSKSETKNASMSCSAAGAGDASFDGSYVAVYNENGYLAVAEPLHEQQRLGVVIEKALLRYGNMDDNRVGVPDIDVTSFILGSEDIRVLARGSQAFFYWSDGDVSAAKYYESGAYVWVESPNMCRSSVETSLRNVIDACYSSFFRDPERGVEDNHVLVSWSNGPVIDISSNPFSGKMFVQMRDHHSGQGYFTCVVPFTRVGEETLKEIIKLFPRTKG